MLRRLHVIDSDHMWCSCRARATAVEHQSECAPTLRRRSATEPALLVGLLITGAAVYLARVHPALAQPLGVGAAVMSALAAIAGVVARVIRR